MKTDCYKLTSQQFYQMRAPSESPLTRMNTNNSISSPPPGDKRRMIAHLESLLRSEIQRREEAEQKLMDYRRRSLNIEEEFSRLLEKYDNHVAVVNGHGSYGQEIWNKLVDEIQLFNADSQRMLAKRCGQIESMMTRRVNEILERTDVEIKRNKKLSEEEYRSVRQQIKQALKLAREIEIENQKLKKQNKDLTFRVNVLKEEKCLLITELNQKKLRLKQLMISIYEESNHSHGNQGSQGTVSQGSHASSRPESPRTPLTSRAKKFSTIEPSIPKFICEPSFKEGKSTVEQQFSRLISASGSRNKDHRSLLSHREGKDQKDQTQMFLKTDHHIKLCLERQRRKNAELKGIVARLHARIKEVEAFLEKALKEHQQAPEGRSPFYEKLMERVKNMLQISATGGQAHFFSSIELSKLIEE